MKKRGDLIFWSFFLLSLLLFLFGLLMTFRKIPFLKLNVLNRGEIVYYLFTEDKEQVDKEIVKTALFFNSQDSEINSLVGDYFKGQGDLVKAADYYQKSIQSNFLISRETYNNLLEVYEELDREEERESLLEFLSQKITRPEEFPLFLNIILAKNSYLVGKDYLESGEGEKALGWWLKATEALPEWSYFRLEVASLYHQLGEKEKAKEVLENCLNYHYPKDHCQEYLKNNLENIEEPGFWQKKILEIKP